jgi:hypothetical protein
VHYSLLDETPAMALGLTDEVWTVRKYILYPTHVSELQHLDWVEQRNSVLESAIETYKRNKALPISWGTTKNRNYLFCMAGRRVLI